MAGKVKRFPFRQRKEPTLSVWFHGQTVSLGSCCWETQLLALEHSDVSTRTHLSIGSACPLVSAKPQVSSIWHSIRIQVDSGCLDHQPSAHFALTQCSL